MFFTKFNHLGVVNNEPGLRNPSSDPAKSLRGDANIGGQVFQRDVFDEMGLLRE